MDTDQSSNILSSIQSEVAKYQMLIDEENQKLKRYKVCNDSVLNAPPSKKKEEMLIICLKECASCSVGATECKATT